jgi:hypothetical protein
MSDAPDGPSCISSPMKIQAVTICINYADYLECIVENRRHFDRWIILTVREDAATRAVCARFGLECRESEVLQPDGRDFHAVTNKGRVLNEGLELLDPDAWALVLDSDVLLPRDFGERARRLPLEPGCLYATAGRKLCESREQFEMIRPCEPWDRLISRHSQALGYFNLFHVRTLPNRYPARPATDTGSHDDYLFTTSFEVDRRRMLTFTAVHTGARIQNWAGRVSAPFAGDPVTDELKSRSRLATVAKDTPGRVAAVIGYFPGGRWRVLGEHFERVYLIDHHAIEAPSGSAMVEADRGFLREAVAAETKGCAAFEFPGGHSAETVAGIPDGTVELLYIPGEPDPECLSRWWRLWRPKLAPRAVVCGDIYGLPHWPDATYSVSLTFGTPDEVQPDGFWRKEIANSLGFEVPRLGPAADEAAIVFVNSGTDQLEPLLLSLHAARKHWSGTIQVWHHGEQNESLRLGCARLQAELIHLAEEAGDLDQLLENACELSTFRSALFLTPLHVAVASLEHAFAETRGELDAFAGEPRRVQGRRYASGRAVWDRIAFAVAQSYCPQDDAGAIVVFDGAPAEWTEDAWGLWCELQAEAALRAAATIRVAPDCSVVTIVTPRDAGDFQRNWLSWRFPRETPILILLCGIAPEEFWLPGLPASAQVIALPIEHSGKFGRVLELVAERCETSRVCLVHPTAAALPGARLFDGAEWASAPVWLHRDERSLAELDITGNDFVPRAYFLFAETGWLRAAAAAATAKAGTVDDASILLRDCAGASATLDMAKHGWRFTPETLLAGARSRRQPLPKVQRRANGDLRLAEDVAVISLPDRGDRRERIAEMFRRERVIFRFADGVRVQLSEIDPVEVSEVGRNNFKLVGGFEKYLCGMAGCRRAHLGILEQARRHRLKSVLIIEDDMHLAEDWLPRLSAAMEELPSGWMQLYFSSADFRKSEPVSKYLHRIRGSYQTTAILYSAAGIEAACQCLRRSRSEIDHWMGRHLHPFGNSYAVRPGVAYQKGGVSDIMSFDRGITA